MAIKFALLLAVAAAAAAAEYCHYASAQPGRAAHRAARCWCCCYSVAVLPLLLCTETLHVTAVLALLKQLAASVLASTVL